MTDVLTNFSEVNFGVEASCVISTMYTYLLDSKDD